jgi:plasmid rolling circle replication initiator protein Rep
MKISLFNSQKYAIVVSTTMKPANHGDDLRSSEIVSDTVLKSCYHTSSLTTIASAKEAIVALDKSGVYRHRLETTDPQFRIVRKIISFEEIEDSDGYQTSKE